jgi:Ni,Fe-hydrogenase maturation factor
LERRWGGDLGGRGPIGHKARHDPSARRARAAPIPSRFFRCSTHVFSVAEAVELGRALNQLPPRLIVYGIEGKDFAAGVGLSAVVDRAADTVAARVLDEIRTLTEGRTSCTSSL